VSIDTSAVQYESDELLRPCTGEDTAIGCCVSAMRVGRQMQFFGARVNLAKALLYAVNGGRDEMTGEQIASPTPPLTGEYVDYEELSKAYDHILDWLARTYVNALDVIHYMQDKYAYERIEMALHDYPLHRFMACGIAGLSVAADSLSAVKYAGVKVFRNATGLAVEFRTEGDFPAYGNNDDRADSIAVGLVESFMVEGAPVPRLPERGVHPVGADDHLERRLRQAHRQHPRRPSGRTALRSRRQPDERP
jgi:formate C-acetyltransferase